MNFYHKCFIIFIASLIIEIASTYYIQAVAEKNAPQMIFWAFIAPFLSLPFIAFQVEAKNWKERIIMAFFLGSGYATGAMIVISFFNT